LRRLRDNGALLPAIVITGHGDVQMAVEAMKNGALDFIEKPFSDDVLIDAITRAVNHAAAQVQNEAAAEAVRQRVATLSERELQVLRGVVAGQANKTIAFDLGISPRTVEVYRANVMTKMQAANLSELVKLAIKASATGD
jgi:two-component system response regulator FixJ